MPIDLDLTKQLTPDEASALADSIARYIVNRRLETPAVLFFEMHKPLSFLASQAAIVAMPFLGPLIGASRMADLSKLLADSKYVELLISRIEEMAAERDAAANASPADPSSPESEDLSAPSASKNSEVSRK